MLNQVQEQEHKNDFYYFCDNPPKFNAKLGSMELDFNGRIEQGHRKNFQLIPHLDAQKSTNINGFILQFGKAMKVDCQYKYLE